jgi:hypothetical protein
MFSFLQRRSRFARALESFGLARCSWSNGQLWVGLPPNADYRRTPVDHIPERPGAVLFAEGPEQAELVAAFAAGPEARAVEHLMIGTTHDYIRPDRPLPYDMSGAVAALAAAKMPALERLSLGAMERLFNGHGYYGRLGDVTFVFEIAPNLVSLDLSGHFDLARPVRHDRLETLAVDVDEVGVSGGPLTEETVAHILSSRFPRLRECELALDADDAPPYAIPEVFLAGTGFAALEAFSMEGLSPEAERRLEAYKSARNLRW